MSKCLRLAGALRLLTKHRATAATTISCRHLHVEITGDDGEESRDSENTNAAQPAAVHSDDAPVGAQPQSELNEIEKAEIHESQHVLRRLEEKLSGAAPKTDTMQMIRNALVEATSAVDLPRMEELRIYADISITNAAIPDPTHPKGLVPAFERVKKNAKLVRFDDEFKFLEEERRDFFIRLPIPKPHPWVEGQPMGRFILHGDGQRRIQGSGEVGFGPQAQLPRKWRGLNLCNNNGLVPPQLDGYVSQTVVVKPSIKQCGRGLFATKPIKKGELIMISPSMVSSVGQAALVDRLVQMTSKLLLRVKAHPELKPYFFDWILTGQPSAKLEHFSNTAVQEVVQQIGGQGTLDELEITELHIPRIAAVIDMNNFLVESFYAEQRGCGYWPVAGFLNHSCEPNCDYDIIPTSSYPTSHWCTGSSAEDREKPVNSAATANSGSVVSTQLMIAEETPESSLVDPYGKYLFCCKANRDLLEGEELLISYVPTHWRFADRQFVLFERYHFKCHCAKCAPTLDWRHRGIFYFAVFMGLFYLTLQLIVINVRGKVEEADQRIKSGIPHPFKNLAVT